MRRALALLLGGMLLSGCTSGFIYTHTVQPLSLDFNKTPVGDRTAKNDIKRLTVYVADVGWNHAAPGRIAKENGINEIYFADLETYSILGVWTQYWAHIYGK